MDLPPCQNMSLFLTIIIFILARVPTPVSAIDDQYLNCSAPFRCGDIDNISYPFWGGNRSASCGYPDFELNCESDVPEITIRDNTYRVLNISDTTRAVTVAREDYFNSLCPSNFVNTTLNFSLFDYAPGTENFTLYYSCPVNFMNGIFGTVIPFQFRCNSDDDTTTNYFYSWDVNTFNASFSQVAEAYFSNCSNRVVIPAFKSTLESLVSNPSSASPTRAIQEGFALQWLADNDLCDKCEGSGGECGYAASTGQFNCHCPDQSYPDFCPSGKGNKLKISTVAGIAAGVVGITVILAILLVVGLRRHWKKKTENDQNVFGPGIFQKKDTKDDRIAEDAFIKNYESLAPRRYCYSDLNRMTKSFSHKLGQGGYGDVYKGQLPDGRLVAVKVLKNSKGNGEEFINEVASISRTSHVNIVSFLGFCYEKQKRALIYDFLPNGSLDQFIYDEESSNTNRKLEWRTMYQIAVGIAKGLAYLHRGCSIRIVHFDIKPHNILLDDEFCPKISDFGLAKLSEKKESIISMLDARGTIGYIAPEVFCRTFGGVSHKSDVYSYGMMILEMVVGRKNANANANANVARSSEIYFPNAIYKNIEPGNDFQLDGVVTEEEKEMAKTMILVSLWCIQTNPYDRPSMHKVLEMLEGGIDNLQIPPKPSLSSPRRSAKQSSAASVSTEITSQEEFTILVTGEN